MKLLFLGPPRTATSSLHNLLSKHHKISPSRIKEPFNKSPFRDIFPTRYFNEFKLINEKIDILIDGTPCAYNFFQDKVKKIPMSKKIIYPVRNPFDRVYSTIKQTIITNHKKYADVVFPSYIKENLKVDLDKLIKYIPYMMDSIHLERAFEVTNDIFIFRFDKMNTDNIFDFIELEPVSEKLPKLNNMRIWYTHNEYKEIRKTIDIFWSEKRKDISKIVLDNLHKIKKYVDVEDWIEEANNILSDV
jgi:hypothetical protein